MGYYTQDEIVKIVNKLIRQHETRDPYRIAEYLGINIIYRDFAKQRGAYKVILKNRFIFLQNGMPPVTEQIVLWHEIGHDMLHRKEAVKAGGFKEFNIFDMRDNRMEYEANVFAAQASLPDDTILEYILLFYGNSVSWERLQNIAMVRHMKMIFQSKENILSLIQNLFLQMEK